MAPWPGMAADASRDYTQLPLDARTIARVRSYIVKRAATISVTGFVNEGVCYFMPVRGPFSELSVASNNRSRGVIYAFC